ncbi:OmpH family outer membrane protein [Candidatus Pelagibacter sp.]|jgi:Skp family chaperone for outer membrane proteins|nr:OmpH family outer membrane protein [Candidatus Pelagibacter sp.]
MIKIKSFYYLCIILFSFSTLCYADNNLAYINIDLILSESEPAKKLFLQLKDKENKVIEQIKKNEENLKIEESKILSSKNIISTDEYNKNVSDFKNKVNEYKRIKNETIQKLNKQRQNEIMRFLKLINPIIEKIMTDKSIEILIEKKNIFIAKSNYDITQFVINDINNNIKNFLIEKK